MTKILIILICAMSMLLLSCDFDDADSLNRKEITDLFYDIEMDFNLGNVFGIMDRVHRDYLHKGDITRHLNEEILDRMGRFSLVDIEVIWIDLKGDYAVVHSRDVYQSEIETVTYTEPEDTGYFSYLKRIGGTWLIYGNQLLLKESIAANK
jgi:hypothetical protein